MKHAIRILALIILSSAYCPAQPAPRRLTQLLNELSQQRNVKIAFSHRLTTPVVVADPSPAGDVPAVLQRWLEGTGLAFKELEGNYYIYQQAESAPAPVPVPVRKTPPPAPRYIPEPTTVPIHTASYAPVAAFGIREPAPQPYFPYARLDPFPVPVPDPVRPPVRTPAPVYRPKLAVKSNLLYDATSTFNLGVEVGLAPKWTLDVSGNYNPWTFSENRKMKHWLVQPEARWWSCTRFSGHFIGIHALGGQYNWGGMLPWGFRSGKMFGSVKNENILEHRYEGWFAGAGFSYGYHWVLGNRWGLEATVGVGYVYLDYDKYPCAKCGRRIGSESKHYVGPTKAGISLVYMIK